MRYSNTVIAVRDMDRSLSFYRELFGQDVQLDLGWCKALTCGLTLQLHFDQIAGFREEQMQFKTYNMELYFETDDMDAFMALLEKHSEVERLHELRTFPWHQRGIHIFDPDGHLIEVSEDMAVVAFREFDKGLNVEETAALIQHPPELVRHWYEIYADRLNKQKQRENLGLSVCGTDCSVCPLHGNMCAGCNEACGKVFHANGKACPIYDCCVNRHRYATCGSCDRMPCDIWKATRDPSMTDEQFSQSIADRVSALRKKQ